MKAIKFISMLMFALALVFGISSCSDSSTIESSKRMGFVIQLPNGITSQRTAYYAESDVTSYKVELKKSETVIDSKTGAPGDLVRFNVTEEGLYTIKVSAYKDSILIAEGQKDSRIWFGAGDVSVKISLEPKALETNLDINLYWNTPLIGATIGNVISFGSWPQSVKEDSVKITDETKTVGSYTYYKGSDGEWYAKCAENAWTNDYVYSNGTSVPEGGSSYNYFKVEPIEWLVVSDNYTGKKLLVSEMIITTSRFDYDSNNYKESEIRSWLNNDFYNTAFTASEQARIALTEVDNSVSSTITLEEIPFSNGINEFACENTYDSIFLLSRYEVSRYEDECTFFDGVRITSDYSRASGAGGNGDAGRVGGWLTRSPGDSNDKDVCVVNYGQPGYFSQVPFSVNNITHGGIVPALCLE